MRQLSEAERRARAAEDLGFEHPRWTSIALGIGLALAWAAGSGLIANLVMDAPDLSFALEPTALVPGLLVVFVPLILRLRRERWIVRNGQRASATLISYRVVGMSASGAGFRANDNYSVIVANFRFLDEQGNERTARAKRTVLSLRKRDLVELEGRPFEIYWHPEFPEQAVPEKNFL